MDNAIENGTMPAMPISEEATDRVIEGVEIYTGLTKREQFAMAAPADIPVWFHEENRLDFKFELSDEEEELLKIYDEDYGNPRLEESWAVRRKLNAAKAAAELDHDKKIFFKWRAYYADELLKALEANNG